MRAYYLILLFTLASTVAQAQEGPFALPQGLLIEGTLPIGRGFQELVIFQTTTGEDATVSPGGGVGFQLGAAYYTAQKFQVALYLGAHISELSPTLDNAHATFRRFTLIPEVRYPLQVAPGHHITLGAGYGMYMGGRLYIDASEVFGIESISRYATAFGPHFQAEYQTSSSERDAIGIGLRGYGLTYANPTTTLNGVEVPTSPEPVLNGGGIELYLRIGFMVGGKEEVAE